MNKITHNGIIQAIEDEGITVRILQSAACGSCKIAGYCSASDQKEKLIYVAHSNIADYHVGESVVVYTEASTGYRAILIGYVIPLVLLVMTLFIIKEVTESDPLAALGSIGILIPYYFVVFLLRRKIYRMVEFKIEKTEKSPSLENISNS